MLRNAGIRSFSWLERFLLIFGILLICIYAANLAYSRVYSHASVQSFWVSQASARTAVAANSQPQSGLPTYACGQKSGSRLTKPACL